MEKIISHSEAGWTGFWTQRLIEAFKVMGVSLEREVGVYNCFRCDLATRDWTHVIELKKDLGDLRCGGGKNFVGLFNYLFVPPDIIEEALKYLVESGLAYVGLITGRTAEPRRVDYIKQRGAELKRVAEFWIVNEACPRVEPPRPLSELVSLYTSELLPGAGQFDVFRIPSPSGSPRHKNSKGERVQCADFLLSPSSAVEEMRRELCEARADLGHPF